MSTNALNQKLSNLFNKVEASLTNNKIWPFFIIFSVCVIFFYPVWLQNKVPLPADALVGAHVPWTELSWEKYPAGIPIKNQEITDSFSQFFPWRSLVGEFWRAGRVPLWNQYMFSGAPFLATWHSAALYPLNVLYIFLKDINAWTLLIFLQLLLSSLFMYLFLTHLKIQKLACVLGAISFSFSGYMIAWLEFATGGHAGLWLPLLLLLEFKFLKEGKNVWFFPIPFVFFFIYTAGDFQVPFYITITYLLFGTFLIFSTREKVKNFGKLMITLFLGILMSLPQLLPTIELFGQSVRISDPYIKEYFFGIMQWEKVTLFIWPDFFGNVVTGNYWGKFGYHEYLGFTGVISLIFMTVALFSKKEKNEKFFWITLFASLLFLFPTPFAYIPFKLRIPGLGTSSASRILFLVDFLVATLGAYGFSKWQKGKASTTKAVIFYILITVGVGLGIILSIFLIKYGNTENLPVIFSNLKVSIKNMIPATIILVFLSSIIFLERILTKKRKFQMILPILVLLFSILELLWFGWKNTPFSPRQFVFPKTKIIDFLLKKPKPFRIAGGIPLNLFLFFRFESAEGYDPIYPSRLSEWFSLVNSGSLNALSGRYGQIYNFSSPLLDYSGVKYVIDYKKDKYGGISEQGEYSLGIKDPKRYESLTREGRIEVFENLHAKPRVWLSSKYKVAKDDSELVRNLLDPENLSKELILLESEPNLENEKGELYYVIKNFKEGFNSIDFDGEASKDALLFLSESYYPGWEAYIDGNPVKILRSNYTFQSIVFPKGSHSVRFIYDPESFRIGKGASIFSAIFMLIYSLYLFRHNKKVNERK